MEKYKIVRLYFKNYSQRVIKRGLTGEQAMAHCCNPETSSSTCTNANGIARTKNKGAWFDSFTTE
tara:strand:- start:896 stop:1090 length:195 start_codon:yes stop_codon:yes gene_type:complete